MSTTTGDGGEEEYTNRLPAEIHLTGDSSSPRVLSLLSSALERLVARNDQIVEAQGSSHGDGGGGVGGRLEVFNGVRAPSISVRKYLERVYRYAECSPSCFVLGFVYIDRLTHAHPASLLTSLNVHRLLVTSIMVASKMLDDVHYNNEFYARIAGVSNGELNRLELELLFLLDFGVVVSSRAFEAYCLHLEKEMIMSDGGSPRSGRPVMPVTVQVLTELALEDEQQSS